MPMHMAEVVPQVHMLACRAKAKKTITFTNVAGEDLDTLYTEMDRDEDDLVVDAEIAGVTNDESDDEDDDDSDYNDEDEDSNNSDDSESDD